MITFPNAKINLGLNVVGKRPDGYHNLETVFYPVLLEDALEINVNYEQEQRFTLYQSGIQLLQSTEDNLVIKACKLLSADYPFPPLEIHLYKNIPIGAGLGGGSSDAAFTLRLINEKFNLNISNNELEKYTAVLGADCAFFINNKPVYAEGIGNIFTPLELCLDGYQIVIVNPNIFVSTKEAFSKVIARKPEYSLLDVINKPVSEWYKYLKNDFEDSVFSLYPEIEEIKDKLYQYGAEFALMSGSGSSVFGLFNPHIDLPEMDFGNFLCIKALLK